MPETIKIRAEQLPLTIEIEAPPPPPVAPTPQVNVRIDRTHTVINQLEQCLAIVTDEFSSPAKSSIVDSMTPHIRALYKQASFHLSGGFGVGDSWRWNPANGPKPPVPSIHPSLLLMAQLAHKWCDNPMLTVYRPSWHQKRVRNVPLTYSDAGTGIQEKGRLAGECKEEWKLLVAETVAAVVSEFGPNTFYDLEIHNEFKGMWELLNKATVLKNQNWADGENMGTPGYGDIDYAPYYDLSFQGAMQGFMKAGLISEMVRCGGPYAVLQSEGKRDADALPVGHPLADRPWGSMGKAPIYAVERFLGQVKKFGLPFHYLVVDGGTHNRDNVFLTDVWGQLKKVSEANVYLRYLLDEAGFYRTPIWWAEHYLTERPLPGTTMITPYQDSMPRRAAVLAAGLCEMAFSGVGRIFQWGLRGEDGDPFLNRENAAYFTAEGEPTLMYQTRLLFEQTFPKGCCLHPVIVDGFGVDGLASDEYVFLYNKMDTPVIVGVEGGIFTMEANEIVATRRW